MHVLYQILLPIGILSAGITLAYFLNSQKRPLPPLPLPTVPQPTIKVVPVETPPSDPMPFYPGRIGLPNPNNGACSYNSSAIVLAHTGITANHFKKNIEEVSVDDLKPIQDLEAKIEEVQKILKDLSKKREELEKKIQNERDLQTKEELDFMTEIESFKAEHPGYIWFQDKNNNDPDSGLKWAMRQFDSDGDRYSGLEKRFIEHKSKQPKPLSVSGISEINSQISHFEGKLEMLNFRRQWLVDTRNNQLTRQKALPKTREKAVELLQLLRGERRGDVNQYSVHDLMLFTNPLPQSGVVTDNLKADLKKMIFEKPWRVIRVGGHLHWWTFVRNPNSQTVDLVNDSQVIRNHLTFQQIYDEWSSPETWRTKQLHFFGWHATLLEL